MRLTEALHYYAAETTPSMGFMKENYSHFRPTTADQDLRREMHKKVTVKPKSKKRDKLKALQESDLFK